MFNDGLGDHGVLFDQLDLEQGLLAFQEENIIVVDCTVFERLYYLGHQAGFCR